MYLTKRQKAILYGMVFGDGYLQATGQHNARLRLEHSSKQREYIEWKYHELKDLFGRRPVALERVHPLSGRTYHYLRLQSNASPALGALRMVFYQNNRKIFPERLDHFLVSPLTLAVWYMDDGYLYGRDQMAFIYLPSYSEQNLDRLTEHLTKQFSLNATWHCSRRKQSCHISFPVAETQKLSALINEYIIPSLKYKLPLTP